jgi:hypothetical protein
MADPLYYFAYLIKLLTFSLYGGSTGRYTTARPHIATLIVNDSFFIYISHTLFDICNLLHIEPKIDVIIGFDKSEGNMSKSV